VNSWDEIVVLVGTQLLVFRPEEVWGPHCTAAGRKKSVRCRESLLDLGGSGWLEVGVAGADGFVDIYNTLADDDCWLKQRCPDHLDSEHALLAPEWTFFDPGRDADLIRRPYPFWTPQGVTGQWPPYVVDASGTPVQAPLDAADGTQDDVQLDLLTRAMAIKVEPDARTALYRYYDEKDRLLYVGITDHLLGRTGAHIIGSSWMDYAVRSTIARYSAREEAVAAETAAIKAEQPLFNDIHNRTPEAKARLVAFLIEHGRADLLAPSVSRG
jgi:hypothetical protein